MKIKSAMFVSVFVVVLTVLLSGTAIAAETDINCDPVQGFNFAPDQQTQVGHLTYLKIGSTELGADLSVTDPEDPTGDNSDVVGVMDDIYWRGTPSDPILFTARLSATNKNTVNLMLHSELSDTGIVMRFDIYEYDPGSGSYFKSFHTGELPVAGLIQKAGTDLVISIELVPAADVVSPANYAFTLGVMPEDMVQDLHLAVSPYSQIVKRWGIAPGGANPGISTSVPTMDFGTVEAGQTPSFVLTVYSDGEVALQIGDVGLSNTVEAPFEVTQDSCTNQSLRPGSTCTVTVTFTEPAAVAGYPVPAAGALGLIMAGLVFAGGPGRRNRIAIVLVIMALAGTVVVSCGGGSSSREGGTTVEYVGDFDIPSSDGTVTIDVVGIRAVPGS